MKKSKQSRVSWPSDSMLCQVKLFLQQDCPAKVSSQSSTKPKSFHLPPGFEATHYPTTSLNLSLIPQIKWHLPPKFILNDDLRIASGGESTETLTENLRISKLMEAFYPHPSAIPSRPSVSRAVEEEGYDDSKTPNITLITIEDEHEAAPQSSHDSKPAPDSSLVASALMKTKEQGSLVDAELLVKFLSDPVTVMNLINGTTIETANNIRQPRYVPQHVTSSAMSPNPETRTHPGNAVSLNPCVAVQSSVTVTTHPTLHYPQKAPSMFQNYPLSEFASLQDSYSTATLKPSPVDAVVFSEPKPQAQYHNISTFSTGKSIEYYKNLIRLHGVASPATNETENYKGRVDNNIKLVKVKIQKPCKYFGRGRGCKLGEKCLYLHDHSKRGRTNVAAEFPRAKRHKFAT